MYAGALNISTPYATGDRMVYDPESAYWIFDLVTNWAMLRYDAMIDDIQEKQSEMELESVEAIRITDAQAVKLIQAGDEAGARQLLTNFTVERGDTIIRDWRALTGMLVVKYSNCLITDPIDEGVEETGYPAWWYDVADYHYGPRVYELDTLRKTDGLNYTGKSLWIPKSTSFDEILSLI